MALGETLREARLRKKLTASQIAAATRMKVQVVEAIEREDFSKVAAPIYGKGFIRLYAEQVGLDATPLIEEYVTRFVSSKTPSLISAAELSAKEEEEKEEEKEKKESHAIYSAAAGAPARRGKPAAEQGPTGDTDEKVQDNEGDLFSLAGVSAAGASGARTVKEKVPRSRAKAKAAVRSETQAVDPGVRRRIKRGFFRLQEIAGKLTYAAVESGNRVAVMFRERWEDICRAWQRSKSGLRDIRSAESLVRSVSVILGILVILVFVVSGLSRCLRRPKPELVPPESHMREELRMAVEVPAPYLD